MIEIIRQPWPWYFTGLLIGLTVPALLLIGNKSFGISSSLRHICAACFPSKIPFFQYEWKKELWNLYFVLGIFIGGLITKFVLDDPNDIVVNESLKNTLMQYGILDYSSIVPKDIFNWESLLSVRGFIMIVIGGFLVGFGTRYAGGCTSGHAIMGLSNLQFPSLIATICFFIGGVITTWFILPLLLAL